MKKLSSGVCLISQRLPGRSFSRHLCLVPLVVRRIESPVILWWLLCIFFSQLTASADTVIAQWTGSSGLWSEPSNWDIGVVPNNSDTTNFVVVINPPSSNSTITINQHVTIDSLSNAANIVIGGSALSLKNGLALNGTLTLLTTNGSSAWLNFVGTQTLSGQGQVVFAAATGYQDNRLYVQGDGGSNPAILTIGPGITIRGTANGAIINYYTSVVSYK
jgi:hypothetical protein